MHDQPGVLDFILACVGGAIVSAIRTTGISLWEKFGVGVVGFLVAYYVGRFVYAYYDMPPEYLAPVGFVIGMVGKEVATVAIHAVREYLPLIVKRKVDGEK